MSFVDQVRIVEAELPEGVVFIAGDFTEFERARNERRPINWKAFCVVRAGKGAVMKLLLCAECTSFHSPPSQAMAWRSCDCGQAQVRWLDPVAGRLEVRAKSLEHTRVIGLHNGMLQAAFGPQRPLGDAGWRETHEVVCEHAQGYLFQAQRRNCWALIVAPHESGDVTWTPWDGTEAAAD